MNDQTTANARALPAHWVANNRPLSILLIGAGGNGSEFFDGLMRLHQGLVALGGAGLQVTVIDDDTVSPSNIVRQRFWPHEVGTHKSIALAQRTNLLMGTAWEAIPARFDAGHPGRYELVVTAVDNVATRLLVSEHRHLANFWLDLGCDRDQGQVVFGKPAHRSLTDLWPCVLAHFPNMGEQKDETRPSCSAADSLMRQDLMINQAVAGAAINVLWKAFRTGRVAYNGVVLDLAQSFTQAIPFMSTPP